MHLYYLDKWNDVRKYFIEQQYTQKIEDELNKDKNIKS